MRRFLVAALLALPVVGLLYTPSHAKYAAYVVEMNTGRVLHSVNADTRNYPASLTKMMTLYMVFDALEQGKIALNTKLNVSRRAAGQPPSKIGVRAGGTITVKDAIFALVTKSANDVATVVAEALGGTEVKFARQMTRKARELGMKSTTFRNASGLPNRGQLSTARDMSILGKHLFYRFPEQYRYFNTASWTYKGRKYKNHNALLTRYDGVDGIKTGYIRASGFNLVASAQRGKHRLIGVVFGGRTSKHRNNVMMKILDKGFAQLDPNFKHAKSVNNKSKHVVADARPPKRTARSADDWGVQVGAYGNYDVARRSAVVAMKRAPTYLGAAQIRIVPLRNGSKKLFRARVVGIERKEAYSACRFFKTTSKSKKMPCMVLKVQDQVASAG